MTNFARHVLVTGTSSGIGAAIVERLLLDGHSVIGVARRETQFSGPYRGLTADLSDEHECEQLLEKIEHVDSFIHAAGFMATAPLGALNAKQSSAMWRVHVAAAEYIANHLRPGMKEKGRIILIGSRAAAGVPGRSQYAAAKAAMVAMARSWASELAPHGTTVNVIAPAATNTPMLSDPDRQSTAPKMPPIGRYIEPAEIAHAATFLLSEHASAITGQVLTICGGSSL